MIKQFFKKFINIITAPFKYNYAAARQAYELRSENERLKRERDEQLKREKQKKSDERAAKNIARLFEQETADQIKQSKKFDQYITNQDATATALYMKTSKSFTKAQDKITDLVASSNYASSVTQLKNNITRANKIIDQYSSKVEEQLSKYKDKYSPQDIQRVRDAVADKINQLKEQVNNLQALVNEAVKQQNILKQVNKTVSSGFKDDVKSAQKTEDVDPYYYEPIYNDMQLSDAYTLLDVYNTDSIKNIIPMFINKDTGVPGKYSLFSQIINSGVGSGALVSTFNDLQIRDIIEVTNIRDAISNAPDEAFAGLFNNMLNYLSDDGLLDFVSWANHSKSSLAAEVRKYISLGFQYRRKEETDVLASDEDAGDYLAYYYYTYRKLREGPNFDLTAFTQSVGPNFIKNILINNRQDTFVGIDPFTYQKLPKKTITKQDIYNLQQDLAEMRDPNYNDLESLLINILKDYKPEEQNES